ncbi:hypothetical protein K432DRAFT_139010 [Lepidopterella palustris CBS 459.81]|uniref:Uncharacterized protein n=1 Tax=Lepidopterella palustris CBS 459.81 TaxID=1314670 RepID=A0A8E2E3C5_9PEZI|nr:hypothetical protein K432DRAFT_139010 [Lepidopterella palustris CBS 459.81]
MYICVVEHKLLGDCLGWPEWYRNRRLYPTTRCLHSHLSRVGDIPCGQSANIEHGANTRTRPSA